MSAVLVKIGNNSGSLTTMPKSPTSPLGITRQEATKNRITWHGNRNVAVLGQRKKVYAPKFLEVKDTQFSVFTNYASSAKRWWVQITGYSGVNIFNGFAYVEFTDISINRVTDSAIIYDFTLLIFEI